MCELGHDKCVCVCEGGVYACVGNECVCVCMCVGEGMNMYMCGGGVRVHITELPTGEYTCLFTPFTPLR